MNRGPTALAAALTLGGSFANAQSGAPSGAGSAIGDPRGKFHQPQFVADYGQFDQEVRPVSRRRAGGAASFQPTIPAIRIRHSSSLASLTSFHACGDHGRDRNRTLADRPR
jgi:hypothetical protein